MNPIKFEQNGLKVEIPVPAPIEQDGQWWEPVAYRKPKKGERFFGLYFTLETAFIDFECDCYWIMHPIPRATPEQLAAIVTRERDDRPVECKEGDMIWTQDGKSLLTKGCAHCQQNIGRHRWVLVEAEKPVPQEPTNSYRICGRAGDCSIKADWVLTCGNWTPKVEKEHPQMICAGAVKCTWETCSHIKPHVKNDVCAFPCHSGYNCVPVDEPKPAVHTSCEGCADLNTNGKCESGPALCFGDIQLDNVTFERKNWTPKAEPATVVGKDGLKIPCTFDAQAWAKEFIRITKNRPEIATDEGAMIGWFANAIMAGYDEARRRIDKDKAPKAEQPALLPCPFCGGAAWLNDVDVCVECKKCTAMTYAQDMDIAVKQWNRRAKPAPKGEGLYE